MKYKQCVKNEAECGWDRRISHQFRAFRCFVSHTMGQRFHNLHYTIDVMKDHLEVRSPQLTEQCPLKPEDQFRAPHSSSILILSWIFFLRLCVCVFHRIPSFSFSLSPPCPSCCYLPPLSPQSHPRLRPSSSLLISTCAEHQQA